ncbi:kinase-like protein [Gonapodya prolifera JEL478]|uniref:Kinase-like protein n=1 Tax=Gonapodya prolifera (strain JEL478) TaxID=1344416 RepID=A0A139AK86_GONPJ|nr:kinase-like protein [Gonapodya prolifera JEL478]|eukprot:KXS16835.1 kinase-like protein [Gonapodya prolifera JEL478]
MDSTVSGAPAPPSRVMLRYPKGEVINGRISVWQLAPKSLGAGSLSSVRKCQDINTGLLAVAKVTDLSPGGTHVNQKLYALRELGTLSHLMTIPHPNIVKIYDVALVGDTAYLIQERVEGIELFDYLTKQGGRIPVHKVRYITAQLLSALHFIHSHHVLHRDLKLDNVLVDPRTLHVTLIDFNLACFYSDNSELTEPVGCINYSSPQILEAALMSRPYKAVLGWSDLWALGVTVFGLLCGYFPFRSERALGLYAEHLALKEKPLKFSETFNVHPAAKSFVQSILTLDSFGKISAASLLAHPFITGAAFASLDVSEIEHALVAQTLRNAMAYSRIFHPHDHLVSTSADISSPDLAVQGRAVYTLLHKTLPFGNLFGKPWIRSDEESDLRERSPSEETLVDGEDDAHSVGKTSKDESDRSSDARPAFRPDRPSFGRPKRPAEVEVTKQKSEEELPRKSMEHPWKRWGASRTSSDSAARPSLEGNNATSASWSPSSDKTRPPTRLASWIRDIVSK